MSNTFDYSNSTTLITGASSGIGAAMAEALAQRGCSIILSARDAAKLEARATQLRRAPKLGRVCFHRQLSHTPTAFVFLSCVGVAGLTLHQLLYSDRLC